MTCQIMGQEAADGHDTPAWEDTCRRIHIFSVIEIGDLVGNRASRERELHTLFPPPYHTFIAQSSAAQDTLAVPGTHIDPCGHSHLCVASSGRSGAAGSRRHVSSCCWSGVSYGARSGIPSGGCSGGV